MERGGERKRGTVERGGGGEQYQRGGGGSKPAQLVLTSNGREGPGRQDQRSHNYGSQPTKYGLITAPKCPKENSKQDIHNQILT